jgi:uncharacterized membrane protein required for colicin V production
MIVDAAIVAFVGFFVWRGWRRGLIVSLAGIAGFIVATILAVLGYRVVAAPIRSTFGMSKGTSYIAGALVIFIIVTLAFFIGGRILTKVVRLTKWGMVNAAGGAALASLWALSWVTVVLLAISVVPSPNSVRTNVERSTLARAIIRGAPEATHAVSRLDLRKMFAAFFPDGRRGSSFG